MGGVFGLEMLHFQQQLRSLESLEAEVALPEVKKEELRLAGKLIEASTREKFDLGEYQDVYTQKLQEVIEAKVAGKQIVRPPEEETPVINLMDALRKSVAQTRRPPAKRTKADEPARRAKPRRGGNRRHAG
jgi:DNA end-binding protein Ku